MSERLPYILQLSSVEVERLTAALGAAIASIDLLGEERRAELREERKALRDIKKAILIQAPPELR